MTQKITKEGVNFIKQWEGLALTAYQGKADRKGVITIGYGHTNLAGTPPVPRLGMKITEQEAHEILDRDLDKAEAAVNRLVKVPLTDNEFAVLVSFIHNLGIGTFQNSTLLRKLNEGKRDEVPKELMKYVNVRQKDGKLQQVQGLVNRRAAEAGLWAKGKFVNSATPDVEKTRPAVVTKENVSWAVTTVGALGSNFASGPIAYALAGIMVLGALYLGYTILRKRNEG
jgi:lysozyme